MLIGIGALASLAPRVWTVYRRLDVLGVQVNADRRAQVDAVHLVDLAAQVDAVQVNADRRAQVDADRREQRPC